MCGLIGSYGIMNVLRAANISIVGSTLCGLLRFWVVAVRKLLLLLLLRYTYVYVQAGGLFI